MARMKVKGSTLFAIDPDDGSLLTLGGVMSFDAGNVTAKTTDTQTWQDETPKPLQTGFDIGEATVSLLTDPTNPTHKRLHELSLEGDSDKKQMTFVLGWSDGTEKPTVDTDGALTLPKSRTFFQFDGWVSSFPFDFTDSAGAVQTDMVIQRTDKGTLTVKNSGAA